MNGVTSLSIKCQTILQIIFLTLLKQLLQLLIRHFELHTNNKTQLQTENDKIYLESS